MNKNKVYVITMLSMYHIQRLLFESGYAQWFNSIVRNNCLAFVFSDKEKESLNVFKISDYNKKMCYKWNTLYRPTI